VQGKKKYQEKLFTHFQLSDRVPKDNFYRQLNEVLDLAKVVKAALHYFIVIIRVEIKAYKPLTL